MILSRMLLTKRSGKSNQNFEKDTGVTRNTVNDDAHQNERGAAMIIALILIATFIFLATAASRTVSAISAEAQKIEQTRQEAARAEYYVSMAEATLKYDVRRLYNDYQTRGKQNELRLGGNGALPMFDPLATLDSRPLLNLDGSQSGENPRTATSLYGRISSWIEEAIVVSQTYLASKIEEKQLSFPESVEIKSFTEAYRKTMQGEAEPIYALRYTVRATSGEFAEIVREDTILLGPVLNEDSPAVVNCSDLELTGSANPANVTWGNPTRLDLNYVRAERLVIYNQSGAIVYNQTVADETSPRSVNYDTSPLTAPAVFIGEAVRGTCQIQVPITVGVTFAQNIAYTVNGVQSVNIIEGDNVRYDWNVTDADPNFTTSYITFGNDPTHFFENVFSNSITQPGPSMSIGSVLHVRDIRYNNNAEQTATINISVCRLARVVNFTVTPSTVTAGNNNNIRFDWQTEQAGQVRIIRISDGQIIYTSNNAASGNWTTVQPQATTDYRIEAISECGAPLAVATTRVTVNPIDPCPPPTVTFTVSPGTVIIGANQMITLTWSVTGTATSVSINNGVGSNLPLNGSIQIPQPQTTTVYTIMAAGDCGSNSGQFQVNVMPQSSNIFVNLSRFENLNYIDLSGYNTYYPLVNYSSYVTFNNYTPGDGYYFTYDINRGTKEFSIKFYYNGYGNYYPPFIDYPTFITRNELIFKVVSSPPVFSSSPYLFESGTDTARNLPNPQNNGSYRCYWDETAANSRYTHGITGTVTQGGGEMSVFFSGLRNPDGSASPVSCIRPTTDMTVDPNSVVSEPIFSRDIPPTHSGEKILEYYGTYSGNNDPIMMFWQKGKAHTECDQYGCYPYPEEAIYRHYNSNMRGSSLYADCLFYDAGSTTKCEITGAVMKR